MATDVLRGDTVEVLASAARTSDPTVGTYHVPGGADGLIVIVDVTAKSDTPTLTVTIQGEDQTSSNTWTVLATSGLTGTGTTVLRVAPGIAVSANATASDVVPAYFTLDCAHTDSDSITYSVAMQIV